MDLLKTIHVTSAILSLSGFIIRGIWMIRGLDILQRKWVKIVPHFIDTVLLVSAILLVMRIQQYPLVDPWLSAKLFALLLYIGLGMVALRFGKTKNQKIWAWCGAIIVFLYILSVAINRNALIIF